MFLKTRSFIILQKATNSITVTSGHETIRVEAWGRGLRVCIVPFGRIPEETWVLEEVPPENVIIGKENEPVYIENSGIRCTIHGTRLSFSRNGELLFSERKPGVSQLLYSRGRSFCPHYRRFPGKQTYDHIRSKKKTYL